MLKTNEIINKYGKPNQNGTYLININLPYPMRLAWDLNTKVTKMRCHKLVANNFINVFKDLLDYYGYDGGSELVVKYYRYETDQEEKFRLKRGVEKRKKTQEKEIAKLKALKEKYKDLDI